MAQNAAGANAPVFEPDQLESLEEAVKEAREREEALKAEAQGLAAEADALRQQMIATAAVLQDLESQLNDLEADLGDLTAEEMQRLRSLQVKRHSLIETLAALERLDRSPPPALFVHPDDAVDAVRGAILLGAVVPELRAQADALATELEALANVRIKIEGERAKIGKAQEGLEVARVESEQLMERKKAAQTEVLREAKFEQTRVRKLAREAKDLKTLISRLETQGVRHLPRARPGSPGQPAQTAKLTAPAPPPTRRNQQNFAALAGKLAMPARGRLLSAFGQRNAIGERSKGVTIETRGQAQVITSVDGDVLFAGSFRSYGQLLIIGTSRGYHVLLAGMERINVIVGQRLLTGEPIGFMGSDTNTGGGSEAALSGTTSGRPHLYIEIRANGNPVDPLKWFADKSGKVTG